MNTAAASPSIWSKARALAWEQGVVCASICAMAFAIDVLVSGSLWIAPPMGTLSSHVAANMSATIGALGALLIAALTSVVRQNVIGELSMDFDPRLRRLPVKTLALTTIVFGVRTLCMLLLALAVCLLQFALYRTWPSFEVILLLLQGYLLLQTIVWTRQSLTGIEYSVSIALLAISLNVAAQMNAMDRAERAAHWHDIETTVATVPMLLFVSFTCFFVALVGIALLRRDARWWLPKPVEIRDSIAGLILAPARPFRNALAAQVWYERQRSGWLLILMWLGFTAALNVLLMVYFRFEMRMAYIWLPYLGLMAAAPMAGAIVLSVGAGPLLTRPIETRHLSLAKLIALFQTLGMGLLLAFATALTLHALQDRPTWEVLMAAWDNREMDILGLVAWAVGPVALTALVCWFFMFFRTGDVVIIVVGSGLLVLGLMALQSEWFASNNNYQSQALFIFWFPLALAILMPVVQFWRCLRLGLLPKRALELAAGVLATGLVFASLYAGALEVDGAIPWFGLAAGGLLVLPGASVTLYLNRLRHR